ncbi:histidine kinase [Muricauda sp. SCSIO 64092]|uniref:sensor histidine kinase n=1 Tax=Allomuricauda sp. SCSIO 64092 TaxID=2908842 RepID=UPI001FF5D8A5|nr:histidine kinase [Muricauda sp. SCSIO 64092]UOY06179.1 histidine kinase [Muricauda sp. SCSIO 64092]
MKNTRLILVVSIIFSLLVNVPRIVFLFDDGYSVASSLLEVSLKDTIFRFLSIFGFCFVLLKLNIDWNRKWFRKKEFLKSSMASIVILIFWTSIFNYFDVIINSNASSTLTSNLNIFVYFLVMLVLLVVSRMIVLRNQSKKDAVEKERLKQQSLESELAALRNQINPHFLFNSLNSLSFLVRKDKKAAVEFIGKLSFLYRYILQSKDQELITIKKELKFLESYIFLISQRYHENFSAKIAIDPLLHQNKIPTLALQLLVENAVKHNEISTDNPLGVNIFNEGTWIVVKNKLQPRTGNIESTNTGLSNLNTRFRLYMDKDIAITKEDGCFTVKIPTQ